MSTYPVLNGRPIDQWTVTELKDELERKNLPVSGLKGDLLKRLFEAMQEEELKGDETPGSIDASVNQASIEQHVDKGASEFVKQGADLVVSVTEAFDESPFATSEVTQEASGNAIVKEENPHSEGHGDTIVKIPEDDTSKKMAVDDEPSDITGGDIKVGFDAHSKILNLEDEPSPPHMKLHSVHEDSVVVAEPEVDSTRMNIDDVPSGLTDSNVELGAKVDCKIVQEGVDATAEGCQITLDDVAVVDQPQPSGQQRNTHKRELRVDESHDSKRPKLSEIIVPVFQADFIPLMEFLSGNPLIAKVSFPSRESRIIGFASIFKDDEDKDDYEEKAEKKAEEEDEDNDDEDGEDYDIENTEIGQCLADGFTAEIVAAHKMGLSWDGDFDESNMVVAVRHNLLLLIFFCEVQRQVEGQLLLTSPSTIEVWQ